LIIFELIRNGKSLTQNFPS